MINWYVFVPKIAIQLLRSNSIEMSIDRIIMSQGIDRLSRLVLQPVSNLIHSANSYAADIKQRKKNINDRY